MENLSHPLAAPTGELTTAPASCPEPASLPSCLDFEPVPLAWRKDGWTPERQRAFIEELADCGVVSEAAARVGMTEQSARRLRRRHDAAAFNQAWDSAIRLGADRLRSVAYERAVNGTVRRRYYRGEVVGEERVYDNRLLIYLLGKAAKPSREEREAERRIEDWDAWMNAVEDGLDEPMLDPDQPQSSPVWRSQGGPWLTSFPPPEGFAGGQWGRGAEYCREVTADERKALDTWTSRGNDEEARRRDCYFRRLEGTFDPPLAELSEPSYQNGTVLTGRGPANQSGVWGLSALPGSSSSAMPKVFVAVAIIT